MKTRMKVVFLLVAVVAMFGPVLSGSLDPPGPPAPTMVTLQQIYDYERTHHHSDSCFDNDNNRFVDCASGSLGSSNGAVKDIQTGLIWLKNANCFSFMTWADANIKAAQLADGQCGLTDGSRAGDWRLATAAEWGALLKPNCSPPTIPDKSGAGCYAEGTQWATGVESFIYWSSSTYLDFSTFGIAANVVNGGENIVSKPQPYYVWPVRNGQ